jgi:hypothetical protein
MKNDFVILLILYKFNISPSMGVRQSADIAQYGTPTEILTKQNKSLENINHDNELSSFFK